MVIVRAVERCDQRAHSYWRPCIACTRQSTSCARVVPRGRGCVDNRFMFARRLTDRAVSPPRSFPVRDGGLGSYAFGRCSPLKAETRIHSYERSSLDTVRLLKLTIPSSRD